VSNNGARVSWSLLSSRQQESININQQLHSPFAESIVALERNGHRIVTEKMWFDYLLPLAGVSHKSSQNNL
jgi:hypothetical protein